MLDKNEQEMLEWYRKCRDKLVPMIEGTACTVSCWSGKTDVKFAVELGMSISLGKPIVLAVTPGVHVPDKLAAVADEIVEFDSNSEDSQKRMMEAIRRVMAKIGK